MERKAQEEGCADRMAVVTSVLKNVCHDVSVCVCSCACHILTSKIHILQAKRGQIGELRTFWLVLTTV